MKKRRKGWRRQKVQVHNNRYVKVMSKKAQVSLKKKWKERIARFRCGNKARKNQHWKNERNWKCRLCRRDIENKQHILKVCIKTKEKMTAKEFLKKDENEREIMRKIEKIRKASLKEKEMKIEEAKEGNKVEQESATQTLKQEY